MKKTFLMSLILIASAASFSSAQVMQIETMSTTSDAPCYDLKNNLSIRNIATYNNSDARTNGEVSKLQQFLQDRGFLIYNPTGFFGQKTLAAVRSFQGSIGVSSNGYVGPITRSKIRDMSCAVTVNNDAPSSSGIATPPVVTNTISSKFTVGDTIYVTSEVINVRELPNINGAIMSRQLRGAIGKIGGGGVEQGGYTWWKVTFDSATVSNGYVAEDFITKYSAPVSTTVPTPIPTTSTTQITITTMKGRIVNSLGQPATYAFFKCGQAAQNNYTLYSPNSLGEVAYSSTVCKEKGGMAWVECPVGQIASHLPMLFDEFNGVTVTCSNASVSTPVPTTTQGTAINGSCGSSSGVIIAQAPTSNLCAEGYASQVSSVLDVFNWSCSGANGGSTAICRAVKPMAETTTSSPRNTLSVSNSATGSFVANGRAYQRGSVYIRIAGNVMSHNPPKVCIQSVGSTVCSNLSSFRDLTSSEWVNNDVVQMVIQDFSDYPLGSYEVYISYPGVNPVKVGDFTLISG